MKRSTANFTFSQVPSVVRPRSTFDRGRTYKTTFDAGYLVPFYFDEVLPGDTVNLFVTSFARLATLIVPFMDNLWMDFFFFFIPIRLVWENWQRFCGEQDNPDDSTDFLVPQVTATPSVGSLYDYFGLPVGLELTVDSLLFRSYNLVWNEFFRDENLQDSVEVPVDDGPDDPADYVLLKRGKRKSDPFTPALPWPQKGPGVELPLAGNIPVGLQSTDNNVLPLAFGFDQVNGSGNAVAFSMNPDSVRNIVGGGTNSYVGAVRNNQTSRQTVTPVFDSPYNLGFPLYADLTQASAITINSLREAFQVQKWYEQLARGGSRYQELVLSMFGTFAGDARLQRPEYLGGGSTPIQVHAVAQTAPPSEVDISPLATLSAYGVAGQQGIGFSKSFVEHGHIIGLVCVRGDYTYQQGIDRMWSRQTKFDFYWPAFAHLGEVPILNKELYYQGTEDDNKAFGYQERWYEYRYGVSKVTGKLRSGIPGSLDVWHLAQYFENLPTLNSTFIQENPPVSRVLAIQNEPQFIFDSVIHSRWARVMPCYSVPGLVDHF